MNEEKDFLNQIFHETKKNLMIQKQGKLPTRIEILEKIVKNLLIFITVYMNESSENFEKITTILEQQHKTNKNIIMILEPIIKNQEQRAEEILDELINSIPKNAKKN